MNLSRSPKHSGSFAITMLLMGLLLAGNSYAQSPLDGFDPNANGPVWAVVAQPDGKILIGGDFTALAPNGGPAVTRNRVARVNPDGSLDTAFDPNANGGVFAIAVQADGKVLIGGGFSNVGGQARNGFARLDAITGQPDSFDAALNASGFVSSIAVQSDGNILVGGSFNNIGGQPRNNIARLDPTTGLADSFNPNANHTVRAMAIQGDGRIVVGGEFATVGGQARNNIARLEPVTGSADSFNPNADGTIWSLAVQADGKILAGGLFAHIGGQARSNIARLDSITGQPDSFNPSPNSMVLAIAVQADGRVLVGGNFNSIGGQPDGGFASLNPATGSADSFHRDLNGTVAAIAVQPEGKIVVGGQFNGTSAMTGPIRNNVARLESNGSLDQTIGNVVPSSVGVYATAVQPDGKILIGGPFHTVAGTTRNGIARLNVDGTLDMAFDPNATGANNFANVGSIVVQADGKILVGGSFTNIGGQPRINIARLDPTTGQADSFAPNATGGGESVHSIVVQADGKILVGGFFTTIGGQLRNNIARLDPATGLADSFDPNSGGPHGGGVETIAVQPDGKILVGGAFATIGGQQRNHIARLDPSTGLADSFDPNSIGSVHVITLQADGKILVGGTFSGTNSIGGQTRDHIARLDPATGLADSFNPNAGATVVFAIALQEDGRIFAGGDLTYIGGQPRRGIARLDPVSGAADSFDANSGTVNSITLQPDGKILIGGSLFTVKGETRGGFARLTNDTAAEQNLAATRRTITWTRHGSSPHLSRVSFEGSNDNQNYTFLGNGSASGSTWTLTGMNFPLGQNLYIRARGFYAGGLSSASESITESVRNVFLAPTFGNISTRARVEAGDKAMIGGFIIIGTEPKTVIVRGIGPSLAVPGALTDPVIEVHGSSGELIATNDNWKEDPNYQHVIDSGLAPPNDLESALWGVINPGTYTVVLRDKNQNPGIGVFEAYDLDQTANSQLANVSTRGYVQTGDGILIGGVIVLGQDPRRVLVRAIGPSLAVNGRIEDPTLELHDGNGGLIFANDNWRTDQEAEIIATTIPPSNDLESAIVRDLAPGNYTAIVRGVNNSEGIAVVEAYGLD